MSDHHKSLELKVGFFLLIGLLVAAGTVVYFGRLGQGLQQFYRITVEFPGASGLLAGADVLLSGARIGYVTTPPEVMPNLQGVSVQLSIREDVQLPTASRFTIGSSGMLGNRFVDVVVPRDADLSTTLAPDSKVEGLRESGFDDLSREGSALLQEARKTIAKLDTAVERLNSSVLKESTLQEVTATVTNLRITSEDFIKTSASLNRVAGRAEEVIEDVSKTVKDASQSVDATLASTRKASDDLTRAVADARKVMQNANLAITALRSGPGLLPALLNDPAMADNVRGLVANLRKHGVLWYRNQAVPSPTPPAERR